MYVNPNTNIRILHNCPLDPTYEHTIFFESANDQTTYFVGLTKYNLTAQSYQRVQRGIARVGIQAENLYDCNYLMFQNTAFGNKWFYAFITAVEYVNPNTSDVFFEMDVMQTWHFDYEMQMCFVEREHALDDTVGANTVPENLELGDYLYQDLGIDQVQNQGYNIVVIATFSGTYDVMEGKYTFQNAEGAYYTGVYSGAVLNVFSSDTDANKFLLDATDANKQDGILSVLMLPTSFNTSPSSLEDYTDYPLFSTSYQYLYDNHYPRNNKLYTYPYNMLYVSNGQGNGAEYHWEFFTSARPYLRTYYGTAATPEMMLVPLNYNGVPINFNEKLMLDSFPQCAYAIDSYRAWLAQNGTKWGINMAGAIAGTLIGVSSAIGAGAVAGLGATAATSSPGEFTHWSGNTINNTGLPSTPSAGALPAGVGGAVAIGNLLAQRKVASTMPPHAKGSSGNVLAASTKNLGFRMYHAHLRAEYARIIDGYFDRFGYATHQNKAPNRNVRRYWTYTKTVGCNITGSIPGDDARRICAIYDNGITFWTNGNNIGNYLLDNRATE